MAKENEGNMQGEDKGHEVKVTVDGKEKEVARGTYIVSEFKKLVGVDANRELVLVEGKKMKPLQDDEKIEIRGGEVFISHVRTGGSSWTSNSRS